MIRRFWQDTPRTPDRDIMQRASGLRIDIYRDPEGALYGDVEIRCEVGNDADALRFIRRLLGDFEKARPDEGLAAG